MSKKGGTDLSFQERFKNRTENVGKDGMAGIIRTADKPITKMETQDKMESWNNLFDNGNLLYNSSEQRK